MTAYPARHAHPIQTVPVPTSASLKDPDCPGHAPPGASTLEVMALVPGEPSAWGLTPEDVRTGRYRKNEVYRDRKRQTEDALIGRVEALFPGLAGDIVYRESSTPATHERFTRATGGTGYGLAATPGQFLDKRPGYRGPLPGLYLCGASTRAGHGIVGAMMSGVGAAKRVLADRS